jgi:predicted nucleic acid-binding protein
MATDGRSKVIIDTSVLINFLKIDRADLLANHPTYRFVLPDLVRHEVTRHYASQVTKLDAAIAAGQLFADDPAAATDLKELAAFAAMDKLKIGEGERAAIAAASIRGLPLAMDDRRAWKRSAVFSATIPREDTVSIIVTLIKTNVIDLKTADTIKTDWQANHRFTLRFGSFAEKL